MTTLACILPIVTRTLNLAWEEPEHRPLILERVQEAREYIYLREEGRRAFMRGTAALPIGERGLVVLPPEAATIDSASLPDGTELPIFAAHTRLKHQCGLHLFPTEAAQSVARLTGDLAVSVHAAPIDVGKTVAVHYASGGSPHKERITLELNPVPLRYHPDAIADFYVGNQPLQSLVKLKDDNGLEISSIHPRRSRAGFRLAVVIAPSHARQVLISFRRNVQIAPMVESDLIESATGLLWKNLLKASQLHFKGALKASESRALSQFIQALDGIFQAELAAQQSDRIMPELRSNEYDDLLSVGWDSEGIRDCEQVRQPLKLPAPCGNDSADLCLLGGVQW